MAKSKKRELIKDATFEDVMKNLKGSYVKAVDLNDARDDTVSTGSLIMDMTLGAQGYPHGKIIEMAGEEGTGKTTMAYCFLANAPEGAPKAFIDFERSFDKVTAKQCGMDLETTIIKKPASIEQAFNDLQEMLALGVKYIAFDSVAAASANSELEADMHSTAVGKGAIKMGQGLRKILPYIEEQGAILYFINQLRDSMDMYGDAKSHPGGNALKFFAHYRFRIKKPAKADMIEGSKGEALGHNMVITVLKDKYKGGRNKIEVPLKYGKGPWIEKEVLGFAVEGQLIEKKGAWFAYDGTNIAQGEPKAIEFLEDNPELTQDLIVKIKDLYRELNGEQ